MSNKLWIETESTNPGVPRLGTNTAIFKLLASASPHVTENPFYKTNVSFYLMEAFSWHN